MSDGKEPNRGDDFDATGIAGKAARAAAGVDTPKTKPKNTQKKNTQKNTQKNAQKNTEKNAQRYVTRDEKTKNSGNSTERVPCRPSIRYKPPGDETRSVTEPDTTLQTAQANAYDFLKDGYSQITQFLHNLDNLTLLSMGLLVVTVVFTLSLYYFAYSSKERLQDRDLMGSKFEKEMVDLKQLFPVQSMRSWAVLRAGVLGVLNVKKPTQPAVIMFASTMENRDVTHCLSKQFAKIVTKVYEASRHIELSQHLEKSHSPLSPADLKLEFDTTMHRGFSSDSRVVIIHDIQKVHGDAAMIFHAFCDNENAPYKDAVLIFTIQLQSESFKESDVDSHLEHIWTDHIGLDNAAALLSRIGNSVAIVSKEEGEDVKNGC